MASSRIRATSPWEPRSGAETLRSGRDALLRFYDSNVMGIVIANNAGVVLEANDAFLDMIGYTRADLESGAIDWRAITPQEWAPLDERAIRELASDGIFSQFEKEYVHKDGRRVPISLGGARIMGTDEQICYITDLSHIRENEGRYRFLAEALPQIVMMSDESRRFVYVNRHYEEYTGLSLGEVNAHWRDVIHPEDIAAIEGARATGESYELEYRLRRNSDGSYRWHFARVLRVPGEFGDARWLAAAIDIDDRKRAEESLRFIEKAGSLLSESLDLETTMKTLLDLMVPEFGDWATINMRDEHGIKTLAMRHSDPSKAHLVNTLTGTYYHNVSGSHSTPGVYRTGVPQLLSNVGEEILRDVVKPEYLPLILEMGAGSLISLPIYSGNDVIGTFGVVTVGDRRQYTEADIPPLKELARRASSAIRNASIYDREHRVAETLQRAALPGSLPHIDGFFLDGYYRSGRGDASIGGDWYDAFIAADGRAIISIGDVAGSGLSAAVTMGNMRQAIRCAAQIHADPALMLDVADRTLRSEQVDRMVTAFVGVIDIVRGTLTYASAGHMPALLCAPDGVVRQLSSRGMPIGYRGLADGESESVVLHPGASLVLYTDGLVEESRDIVSGEAKLHTAVLQALRSNAPRPAQSLVERMLGGTDARDDIAVLVAAADSRDVTAM